MSNSKPNYFQRRTKPQGPRANERIRALDVQVIGSDGANLGAMPLNKAIELAKKEDLDLIVHAATQCPSKQNVAFYKVHFITNREVIEAVHDKTAGFTNYETGGSETNSQTLANLLIAF